ncbi:antifreeze glycopeptide AFGP poly protein [Rhodotorula diobovata]|uniref:Antifreeze glycopeptide AFGP poly protein n=1 Tax=Rhodotorula diobovata TaxID=5288 RepID=A0A5C5FP65_9BASI|nr:antifreeze glycopeptide AFGP poly protein [Rhodotorula diobovata]
MRTAFSSLSLASLASVALAGSIGNIPGGYGRFPCSQLDGQGKVIADPNQCLEAYLLPPGQGDDSGLQGDGLTPVNPECVRAGADGGFYCGISGAQCETNDNCDNGVCNDGVCGGGPSSTCEQDSDCLGYLYCTSPGNEYVGTCGGTGTYCQDPYPGDEDGTAADNFDVYSQYCSTGFCSLAAGGLCVDYVTEVGGDCSQDPDYSCGSDAESGASLECDLETLKCKVHHEPTGYRARARRAAALGKAALFKRRACPLSHTACAIGGAKGFECIDTSTNIEQCGACALEGGVDCTALPGVEAVGCSAGVCEIWSCANGHKYNSATATCVPDRI